MGLDTLLSPMTGLSSILRTGSGSLKQIPPVACMEVVAAGFSTAGVDVRGGLPADTGAGVRLLEITEGKEAIGTSGGSIRLFFGRNSSTFGDHLIPSCSFVSSDISCSARKTSSLASSA